MSIGINIGTGSPSVSLMPPIDWGTKEFHEHSVQFYADDAFLLDELSRFIGSALGAGDAGVVIATRAHRNGLAQRLKARGLDISLAARQGRYVSLDAAETLAKLMPNGILDATRFAELIGEVIARAAVSVTSERPRVAAFGEMVAILWAEGKTAAAIELEQLWNGLARTHAFDLRCAYPMSLFGQAEDAGSIADVCATHSHVIPTESYTALTDEAERLRAIVLLQQKAQALESEIDERKKAQKYLEQAVAARDEFLSVAAHELKTPITSLGGFAQLLLRDIKRKGEIAPERIESALSIIDAQTRKLNHLVARLLDSAQIEAGKLRIESANTDLVALVRSVLAQQQNSANHEFIVCGPERLEARIDPIRFEQVITNLVSNAVKFSPEGGNVTVALSQDGDGYIRLSVTDEGIGIPSDQREVVFDRFHQSRSEHHLTGLGLGLYITHEIVGLHGGSIKIEEPEHAGSRFVVIIPPSPSDL